MKNKRGIRYLAVIIALVLVLVEFQVPVAANEVVSTIDNECASYEYATNGGTTNEEVVDEIRRNLVNRVSSFYVDASMAQVDDSVCNKLFDAALEHTGVPYEGDYLSFQYKTNTHSVEKISDNTFRIEYQVEYYTSLEQEEQVNQKIQEIVSSLNLKEKNNYQKILAIYDYITENVKYDYKGLNDKSDYLKYTAFGAVVKKTCVCQGYAILLYRLALEAGLDCRIDTGISNDQNHAWNIINIDGLYYYLDSTWDAGVEQYKFFLKGSGAFENHERDDFSKERLVGYSFDENSFEKEEVHTCGNFQYYLNCGKAYITSYNGTETEVTVPSSLDGYSVFQINKYGIKNANIKKLTLSEGIKHLGESAISCSNLEELVLPSTLMLSSSNGNYNSGLGCFELYGELKKIVVPEENQYICVADNVLYSKNLKTLILYPAGDSRKTLTIPDGVKTIGNQAFEYATNIESVFMPNSITTIGYWAFNGCSRLKNITISSSCEEIGQFAFNDTGIKKLILPKTLDAFCWPGYSQMTQLVEIQVEEGGKYSSIDNMLIYDSGTTKHLCLVPETKEGMLEIPNGVQIVDEAAMQRIPNVSAVKMPESVVRVSEKNMEECKDGLAIYGYDNTFAQSFARARGWDFFSLGVADVGVLESGRINEKLCWSIDTQYRLSVTGTGEIPNYDGSDSPWNHLRELIQSVEFSDGITVIGNNAFRECRGIQKIKWPSTLKAIGRYAFYAIAVENIAFPDSLERIEAFAFYGALTKEFYLPKRLSYIADGAFGDEYISKLKYIEVDPSNKFFKSVDGALLSKDGTELYCVPACLSNVETFSSSFIHPTYQYSISRTYIVPEGVKRIHKYALQAIEVHELVFPDSVEQIDGGISSQSVHRIVFGDGINSLPKIYCSWLYEIAFGKSVKTVGANIINSSHLKSILYRGTKEEFDGINIHSENVGFSGAVLHYNRVKNEHSWKVVEETESYLKYSCVDCCLQKEHSCTHENGCTCKCGKSEHRYENQPYLRDGQGRHYRICLECKKESEHSHCIEGDKERKQIKEATCNEAGGYYELIYCSICGQQVKENYVSIKSTGVHKDNNGDEKCDLCNTNLHKHVGKKISKKNPTCSSYGIKEYYVCSCGKKYSDSACKKQINDFNSWKTGDGKIAKIAHSEKTIITKATTKADGKIEVKCSVCNKVTKTTAIKKIKSVTLKYTSTTYTGKELKPTVTVKDSAGKAVASKYYTVTYKKNKNVGTATVEVKFRGNYSGIVTKTFKINPKDTKITKLEAKSKSVKVTWTKLTTQTTGYEVQVATDNKFTRNVKKETITKNTTTSRTISGLKAKTKYYVRVRTYKTVDGKKYYSGWVVYKNTVKTK